MNAAILFPAITSTVGLFACMYGLLNMAQVSPQMRMTKWVTAWLLSFICLFFTTLSLWIMVARY